MMIKRRIALSNILMLLIPVLLILLLAGLLYLSYSNLYAIPEQGLMADYRKTHQVQQLIKTATNVMEYAQKESIIKNQEENLAGELRQMGYYLQIIGADGEEYSNFTPRCHEIFHKFDIKNENTPDFFTIETDGASIMQSYILINNEAHVLTAINPAYSPVDVDLGGHAKTLYSYAAILLILSLIIILATNSIITGRMGKALITPLELLSYGAGQIKEGNLDFEIYYDRLDEFGEVCSDFNEMRLRLRESVELRLKYEQDRKELIAGISHDLRTPLTAIKGYVKGILDGVASTPEKQAHYLDIIHTQTSNMDLLVDKLFLFSRLDTGHFPFYFETIELSCYLEAFLADATDKFMQSGLAIHFENKCETRLMVNVDKSEMSRVITNILENSAKYKVKDQGKIYVTLSDKRGNAESGSEMAILELCDDGEGVAEKTLPHLFKSFYRADPSRTDSTKNSGLGLSIAERIVKAHNGQIKAENRGGLCIIIKLPVVRNRA